MLRLGARSGRVQGIVPLGGHWRLKFRPERAATHQPRAQRSAASRAAPPWVSMITTPSPERATQRFSRDVFQRRDRQGALPRNRVVCARTVKALPHGRASDLRFFRLFGTRFVSPFQGSIARESCFPGRRCALPWADLFGPLGGEFCGGSFGASCAPALQFKALPFEVRRAIIFDRIWAFWYHNAKRLSDLD